MITFLLDYTIGDRVYVYSRSFEGIVRSIDIREDAVFYRVEDQKGTSVKCPASVMEGAS